ncbi:MAG: chromosome partitioning protein ParB [Polaromonas sp.]|nr:chromosome partitioning protein ParB [Polaromonas sp.]
MSRKLFEKGESISLPAGPSAVSVQTQHPGRPRTAIGGMAQFVVDESKVRVELESLRAEYVKHEGSKPARLLDPRTIKPSIWANRHEDSFRSVEFASLKAEIENAGGNVQAIKVRPVISVQTDPGLVKQTEHVADMLQKGGVEPFNPPYEYEIVFGHRRHRACLELEIPVLALIEETTEKDLFVDMDRENRLRADLSPWEQGMMYAKALDKGLFTSNARLASAVGRDTGLIGKALALARLPMGIVDAFPSPLEIQYRWAKPLTDRLQLDPEAITHRASYLKKNKKKLNAREVFELLTSAQPIDEEVNKQSGSHAAQSQPLTGETSQKVTLGKRGKPMATVSTDSRGRVMVRFKSSISPAQHAALTRMLQDFLDTPH